MVYRGSTEAFVAALTVTLTATLLAMTGARAADEAKYPSWKGQWNAIVAPGLEGRQFKFDPTKSRGLAQEAPLTPEYQKVLADSMAEQAKGGLGNYPTARCLPGGMPRMMATQAQEYIITPETTYILLGGEDPLRRIYTDGRDWPDKIVPSFDGYSIGRWVDRDASGRYHTLEVETRGFKGPRTLDASGLPLHPDNKTILKERFYLDPANPNRLHDQITTIDNAYTRPWTVIRDFDREEKPIWTETNCASGNHYVFLKKESYFVSADGYLMPTRKDQSAPDLQNFK
jgi:hypothetical protein